MAEPVGKIVRDGIWGNNPSFVQMLGLCPLLAVTTNTVNGFGLGLATMLVLGLSNVAISLVREWVRPEVRIPIFVVVIASFVTMVELTMNAFFHELYNILGVFVALIVSNCIIIGRAEAFAARNSVAKSLVDGLAMGIGTAFALVALGAFREVFGQGTLFAQAHLMFGEAARGLTITVLPEYRGFLLALLPPGAFIGLGLLIALKNWIDQRLERRAAAPRPATA